MAGCHETSLWFDGSSSGGAQYWSSICSKAGREYVYSIIGPLYHKYNIIGPLYISMYVYSIIGPLYIYIYYKYVCVQYYRATIL